MVTLLLVIGAGYAAFRLALSDYPAVHAADGGMGGMMGRGSSGMMTGSSAMGGTAQSATPVSIRALTVRLAGAAAIDRRADTIIERTKRVHLVALASPEGVPDMTWNVDGLVNPTVVIPRGARVTIDLFNADEDHQHGWELTVTPPPYRFMAMMYAAVAQPSSFAMPVQEASSARWLGHSLHFTAADSGTFYYFCPVPGHAQKGMYGKLVVR